MERDVQRRLGAKCIIGRSQALLGTYKLRRSIRFPRARPTTRPRSCASRPSSVPVARHCTWANQDIRDSFRLVASTRKSRMGDARLGRGSVMRLLGIAGRLRKFPLCNADKPADLRSARRPDPPTVSMICDVVTCSMTLGLALVAIPASRMPARNRSASLWLRAEGLRTSRPTTGRSGRAWSTLAE
jgi:hypothetical protein